ncbi:MAG: hypothetical protein ACPHZY_03830 [Flavobacteriaceae bacterium]
MEWLQILLVALAAFLALRLLYRRFWMPSKSDSSCGKNCDC